MLRCKSSSGYANDRPVLNEEWHFLNTLKVFDVIATWSSHFNPNRNRFSPASIFGKERMDLGDTSVSIC